jgi:hypothetical protein
MNAPLYTPLRADADKDFRFWILDFGFEAAISGTA